ncbi:MAG: hypothetical protein WAW11_00645 [Patescibacteria group bacterium]
MEASLKVGVDFQAQVSKGVCSKCLCSVTSGIEPDDLVQIYPYTASDELVAIRKLCDGRPSGPFISFPINKLEMSESQKVHIKNGFGHTKTGNRFNIATVKNSVCAKLLKRATGLSVDQSVQFFPYSVDVSIEDNDNGMWVLSPIIMIAVRKIKKNVLKGPFILVDATCLNLNMEQKNRLWGIIYHGLQNFSADNGIDGNKATALFTKFREEVSFMSEEPCCEQIEN